MTHTTDMIDVKAIERFITDTILPLTINTLDVRGDRWRGELFGIRDVTITWGLSEPNLDDDELSCLPHVEHGRFKYTNESHLDKTVDQTDDHMWLWVNHNDVECGVTMPLDTTMTQQYIGHILADSLVRTLLSESTNNDASAVEIMSQCLFDSPNDEDDGGGGVLQITASIANYST